jgi:hypothetical protein
MKQLNKSQLNELGRIEEAQWDIICTILDNAAIIEIDNAIRPEITADVRAHACGKIEAIKDIQMVLKTERKEALVRLGKITNVRD